MRYRIAIPKIDCTKVMPGLKQAGNITMNFVKNHKVELLSGITVTAITDNIRVRYERYKEKKAFEKSAMLQKQVARKHEAEINALKADAAVAQEAVKRVDQLEQIITQIMEGDENP